ncbi:MAG: GTPase domain-containing protein [Cuniculiplasma sp.]
MSRRIWKLSLIGAPGTGKSSIISRIVYDTDAAGTTARGLLTKKIKVKKGGHNLDFEFIFQEIDGLEGDAKQIAGSSGIVLIFDVTQPMDGAEVNRFAKFLGGLEKKPMIFLAANKIDRKYEAVTWQEDLEPIASSLDAPLYMISSRQSDTVSEMITDIAIRLLERKNEKR